MAIWDKDVDTKLDYLMDYLGGEELVLEIARALPLGKLEETLDWILQANDLAGDEVED